VLTVNSLCVQLNYKVLTLCAHFVVYLQKDSISDSANVAISRTVLQETKQGVGDQGYHKAGPYHDGKRERLVFVHPGRPRQTCSNGSGTVEQADDLRRFDEDGECCPMKVECKPKQADGDESTQRASWQGSSRASAG
jgi:hypothetical protein